MKKGLFIFCILFFSAKAFAGHIAGGEVYYKYLGPGSSANTSRYEITLRLFRECIILVPNTAAMPTSVALTIFNNTSSSTQFGPQLTVPQSTFTNISLVPGPCVNPVPNPPICYQVATFTLKDVELPNTAAGYVITFQTCCRTDDIKNMVKVPIVQGQGNVFNGDGATYTGQIPGSNALPTGNNSSPVFSLKDTSLVCLDSPFKLDFSATDPDSDSLSYDFCAAYNRGNTTAAGDLNYSAPPYQEIGYLPGFSGSTPLGSQVTIDPVTGIISGTAPSQAGRYVVTVCINEWRNGKVISQHRKDFTLRVEACTLTGAVLKPSYVTCNGTTLTFENESTNASINSYLWDFGVPNLTTDTSTLPTPTFDYLSSGKDSGTYTVKLKVTSIGGCQDSTTAKVLVYPGFNTDFTVQATCLLNPYTFQDATTSKYGTVNSWRWDFGDNTSTADTSISKDTAWKYNTAGNVQVRLITSNTKGCVDTMTKTISVLDKPVLSLPFRDTLICSIDTLALRVNLNSGTAAWSPQAGPNQSRIINATSTSPLVFPKDTTKYYVTVSDNGCVNTDSVTVNVLQFISVKLQPDTGICLTDSLQLTPVSYALSYQWHASSGETILPVKYPWVKPAAQTLYYVTANLGKCQANDSVMVKVAPYPVAVLGQDTIICFGSRVQLKGTITGSTFSWSPAASLINTNTLTPIAGPSRTTAYVLSVNDTIGCPKPKSDTLIVTVIPPLTIDAGKDTTVTPNQPVQLQASGALSYEWTPVTGLNDPFIANPVATLDNTVDSVVYRVVGSEGGCSAEDYITVRIYKNGIDIIVPSAFTPNGDGKNDQIRPYTYGINQLRYFSIFNRWGQVLFTTTQIGKGWDGTFNGVKQPPGTYVYQAMGVDFGGNTVFRKGTLVLIR